MPLIRWQPGASAELADRMTRIFDDALRGAGEGTTSLGAWSPAINVFERGNDVVVEAELPGVSKDDIDVRVENNVLTLRGERKQRQEVKEDQYYRFESNFGSFSRSFSLPSTIDVGRIDATFRDGMLVLILPKAEEAKPKQISIK